MQLLKFMTTLHLAFLLACVQSIHAHIIIEINEQAQDVMAQSGGLDRVGMISFLSAAWLALAHQSSAGFMRCSDPVI